MRVNPASASPQISSRGLSSIVTRGRLALRRWREAALVDEIRTLSPEDSFRALPAELRPQDAWHSWDPTPWAHPWLTSFNLEAAKAHSNLLLEQVVQNYGRLDRQASHRYGFVGNLANNMTFRATLLRERGLAVTTFLHPHDRHVMSQPGWEFSDAVIASGETNIDRLATEGLTLPEVSEAVTLPAQNPDISSLLILARDTPSRQWSRKVSPGFVRQLDVLLWPSYLTFLPALEALQSCASLLAAQAPYLAYLANRPYLATQTGGDLWLECSRNDSFGILQRRSYERAAAILATNPWAFSNARRFGFRHVLYLPLMVDTERYAPGSREARSTWQRQTGGDFFVLVTARVDRRWKGSQIGLEGFIQFAKGHPQARLVLIGWGENNAETVDELKRRGLEGRFIQLPISGKRKLVEYLRAADCLLDQFVIGYYGATALEAMATGVPVVMRLAKGQYDALCPTGAPPVLEARSPEEVAAQLAKLAASSDERGRVAAASRRWVEQNHGVEVWGDRYAALLNAVALGARLDFRRSPLRSRLDQNEIGYHAASLRAAPAFPNYLI